MLQNLVVVLIVAAATLYTVWSLTPPRVRFSALTQLDRRLGPGWLRGYLVAPLLKRALPTGGCASCGSSSAAPAVRRPPSRP